MRCTNYDECGGDSVVAASYQGNVAYVLCEPCALFLMQIEQEENQDGTS